LAYAAQPAIPAAIPEPAQPPADSTSAAKTRAEQVREDRRQRRVDRYNEVVALYRKGVSHQSHAAYGAEDDPALPARQPVS